MSQKRSGRGQIRARRHALRMAKSGIPCGLCHQGFDLALPLNHPMRLSADHIIPVRDGGGNRASNIRPMHTICNQRRDWRDAARQPVIAGQE